VRDWESYEREREKILFELSEKGTMVLATSSDDFVTARSMSILVFKGKVYFQTGKLMDKYLQLSKNRNVALCIHNIQIQGTARDIGPWDKNVEILQEYRKRHASSYEAYGTMESQTVIETTIRNVKKWEYSEGDPYICILDFEKETVKKGPYNAQEEASNIVFNLT